MFLYIDSSLTIDQSMVLCVRYKKEQFFSHIVVIKRLSLNCVKQANKDNSSDRMCALTSAVILPAVRLEYSLQLRKICEFKHIRHHL